MKDRQSDVLMHDGPLAFLFNTYAIGDGLLTAQIEDERGKFNLNDLAAGGDPNARKVKVLRAKRLFELMQVSPDLVDAIVDWVDQDEVPEPAGAESLYYQNLKPPYRAANAPLQTLRELRLIKGVTAENFEKIARLVTVYPQEGEGRVNLNTAESAVLQALDPRISQAVAGEIIQSRLTKRFKNWIGSAALRPWGRAALQNAYDIKSDLFFRPHEAHRERRGQTSPRDAAPRSEYRHQFPSSTTAFYEIGRSRAPLLQRHKSFRGKINSSVTPLLSILHPNIDSPPRDRPFRGELIQGGKKRAQDNCYSRLNGLCLQLYRHVFLAPAGRCSRTRAEHNSCRIAKPSPASLSGA